MKLPFRPSGIPAILAYLGGFLAIALILYGLVLGLRLIPPKQLSIAAGTKGSAYYQIAQQYQAILAEDNIHLEIIETAGSQENNTLLNAAERQVDIALIQGGIKASKPELNALAAVFPEPLLAFARVDAQLKGNPFYWSGKRVALGAKGSGTRLVVEQLAQLTNAPALASNEPETYLGGKAASEALRAGQLDLAFFVAPLSAPYLQSLYSDPAIQLLPMEHGEALASQLHEAHYVDLYSGAVRYQPPYPEATTALITLVAKLVAQDDLHPALVNRLVHAAKRLHGKRETLVMSEPFPNAGLLDMNPDLYAAKLLRDGFNPLEKTLPYWIVAQINRFAILLSPIIFLLLPLFKILPALLAWRMQSRVYRYYDRLHEIDLRLAERDKSPLKDNEKQSLAQELIEIELGLRCESLPLKYRESAYTAVQHVHLVRHRLESLS